MDKLGVHNRTKEKRRISDEEDGEVNVLGGEGNRGEWRVASGRVDYQPVSISTFAILRQVTITTHPPWRSLYVFAFEIDIILQSVYSKDCVCV